jgi:hypothetical protein
VEENQRVGGGGGLSIGRRLGTWRRKKLGPRAAARGVKEGAAPTRPGAGRRGLRPVSDAAHVGVPGGNREREGGREEASGWAGSWDGPHPSAK